MTLSILRAWTSRYSILVLSALTAGMMAGCDDPGDALVTLAGSTMGTGYSVKLALPPDLEAEVLDEQIEAILFRINALMSTYIDDAELSRFNASESSAWFDVSPELRLVVAEALEISRLSDGRFDATVGPLVNLWGFGPGPVLDDLPSQSQIERARERVGYEKVSTRIEPPGIKKAHPGLVIDLSAIAKGYAVDQIAELLDEYGAKAYLVEIGGEIRVRGIKPDGSAWKVAIERPVSGTRSVQRVLSVSDLAIATSGDYRNFFEIDGHRYSHTIDPANGRPVTHHLASVSVIAQTAMFADAVATALMVAGPEEGYGLAQELGVAAMFIVRTEDGFEERSTPDFAAVVGK